MLCYLIAQEEKETLNIFTEYQQNEDSEYLITYIEGKTEDDLQNFLMKYFQNQEISKFRVLRSQRDEKLQKVFKKFKKSLNLDKLAKGLTKMFKKAYAQIEPNHLNMNKVIKKKTFQKS